MASRRTAPGAASAKYASYTEMGSSGCPYRAGRKYRVSLIDAGATAGWVESDAKSDVVPALFTPAITKFDETIDKLYEWPEKKRSRRTVVAGHAVPGDRAGAADSTIKKAGSTGCPSSPPSPTG